MRIESFSAEGVPGLSEIRIRPRDGLVGWVGGDSRHRRVLVDLFLWALGLPGRESGARRRWEGGQEPTPGLELEIRVAGRELLVRDRGMVMEGGEAGVRSPADAVGLAPEDLALAWAGRPEVELETLCEHGVRILAGRRGLGRVEGGLSRLEGLGRKRGPPDPGDEAAADMPTPEERSELRAELAGVRERIQELEDVPERLRTLEVELRSLRADATEVAGDLEVATMDWLRERQDAETHLQAYRDQARELRARMRRLEEAGPDSPCPFCGRTLDDHYDSVVSELQDEWERLVQDGKWWRRRREQLELKPQHLQELEGRSVRLQAAVEECAERLERCRFDLRELDELRKRRRTIRERLGVEPGEEGELPARDSPEEGRRRILLEAFGDVRRELLDEAWSRLLGRAGTYLNRISGGRTLGLVRLDDGTPALLEDGRVVLPSTEEDRASARIALRLALAVLLVEDGVALESILVDEPFARMEPPARLRSVELLRSLGPRLPQILLLARGRAAEAAPERFDQILEFREDRREGTATLRELPGGVGILRII